MRIHTAWFTTAPLFLLTVACSDAGTATGVAPRPVRLEAAAITAPSDCQARIDELAAATTVVTITGKNADRERAGLLKILSDANALLGVGKNADAATKLSNYIVKVQQLEDAGRIAAADADALIAGANEAIACIGAIGA
jgi:hypothetical protein